MDHKQFREKIIRISEEKQILINASVEITNKCNFKCPHCYLQSVNDKLHLSFADYKRFLMQLREKGCMFLTLTGGEILLHPQFKEFYLFAKQIGYIISLFTNASMLSDDIIDFLVANKPYKIEITLYGFNRESYIDATGQDSWDVIFRALATLKNKKLPFSLKATVTPQNHLWLQDFRRIANSFGVGFRFDPYIVKPPEKKMDDSDIEQIRLDEENMAKLMIEDSAYKELLLEKLSKKQIDEQRKDDKLYRCGPGITSIYITAQGRALICPTAMEYFYDLKNGSIDGAVSFLREIGNRKMPATMKCCKCRLINICKYCPSRFYNDSGNHHTPSEWMCKTAGVIASKLENE